MSFNVSQNTRGWPVTQSAAQTGAFSAGSLSMPTLTNTPVIAHRSTRNMLACSNCAASHKKCNMEYPYSISKCELCNLLGLQCHPRTSQRRRGRRTHRQPGGVTQHDPAGDFSFPAPQPSTSSAIDVNVTQLEHIQNFPAQVVNCLSTAEANSRTQINFIAGSFYPELDPQPTWQMPGATFHPNSIYVNHLPFIYNDNTLAQYAFNPDARGGLLNNKLDQSPPRGSPPASQ